MDKSRDNTTVYSDGSLHLPPPRHSLSRQTEPPRASGAAPPGAGQHQRPATGAAVPGGARLHR